MQELICDSCEQPIVNRHTRVQVLIFTEEPIADPQLDLCTACGDDVIKSTKVQRGQDKAKERIRTWMPSEGPSGPPDESPKPDNVLQPYLAQGR